MAYQPLLVIWCQILFLYIYQIYMIWFGLIGFYGISTVIGYLMPNPVFIYISNLYDLVWFDRVLWHINRYWLFNAKSCFYIYIKSIWFGLVWSGLWHINRYWLFDAKSCFYIYIKSIWFGLVRSGFMAYQPLLVIWCQILFIYIYIY